MKALVAGGAGFIGIALVEALAKRNHDVFVIDDCSTGQNGGDARIAADTYWRDDVLALSDEEAASAFEGTDVVFNLIGRTWHHGSLTDPVGDARANVLAPLRVLKMAKDHCPDAHVIYSGSRSQYGKIYTKPVSESHIMNPEDVNGIHKKAAEELHFMFSKQFETKVTSLRLPNIMGPRHQTDTSDGVVNWFLSQAARGKEIRASRRTRDIIHVSEAVDAFLLAAENPHCFNRAFNVGGREILLLDYARMVANLFPVSVVPLEKESSVEIGDYLADASRFHDASGWSLSEKAFESMLEETAEWYRERFTPKERQ